MRISPTILGAALLSFLCFGLTPRTNADINVLVVGSIRNTRDSLRSGNSVAFDPNQVVVHLGEILKKDPAISGKVNVVLEERYRRGRFGAAHSLSSWFNWPDNAEARWSTLRGEAGTAWDHIVLIGDPYTIESMPGVYADGVAVVAKEVAKGKAKLTLLMAWPGSSSTATVAHYKEVHYRTGRSGGIAVAPAGLAWASLKPKAAGTTHPTPDGSYLAAATVYSRIFNKSAKSSNYSYNDSIAAHAHKVVQANKGKSQFKGLFKFAHPFKMKYVRSRHINFNETGTSTERGFRLALTRDMAKSGLTFKDYREPSSWPAALAPVDFNYGRIYAEPRKQYAVDPALYQRSYGFVYQKWQRNNDVYTAAILGDDIRLANDMIKWKQVAKDVRCIPMRTMWGKIHKLVPKELPERDDKAHLSPAAEAAAGAYMYTLLSGRCTLGAEPTKKKGKHYRNWLLWVGRKVGYETAWQMGRTQVRAPGFRVLPSSPKSKTVNPGKTDKLSVRFMMKPKARVTVIISIDNPKAAALPKSKSKRVLTFTPTNYNKPQFIVFKGKKSKKAKEAFNVIFKTSSSDPVYNGLTDSWSYTTQRRKKK